MGIEPTSEAWEASNITLKRWIWQHFYYSDQPQMENEWKMESPDLLVHLPFHG